MTTTTSAPAKLAYLDLLNRISLGESRAGVYLKAWADVTPDPELKKAVAFVAGRETSHGVVFCQLIERLGFCLEESEDLQFAERVRIYGDPTLSDADKVRYGSANRDQRAIDNAFASIDERINDETVDSLTRDTLRWYVHEERDSGTLLRGVYAKYETPAGNGASAQANGIGADTQAVMDCMTQGFAAVQQSLKELVETLSKPARGK